jgi:hypothetical protein
VAERTAASPRGRTGGGGQRRSPSVAHCGGGGPHGTTSGESTRQLSLHSWRCLRIYSIHPRVLIAHAPDAVPGNAPLSGLSEARETISRVCFPVCLPLTVTPSLPILRTVSHTC